jgi:hypothetical protein
MKLATFVTAFAFMALSKVTYADSRKLGKKNSKKGSSNDAWYSGPNGPALFPKLLLECLDEGKSICSLSQTYAAAYDINATGDFFVGLNDFFILQVADGIGDLNPSFFNDGEYADFLPLPFYAFCCDEGDTSSGVTGLNFE